MIYAEKAWIFAGADKLHWTVERALHDMTIESMLKPLSHALSRLLQNGSIKSSLDVDPETLAGILIKGSEAIVHSHNIEAKEIRQILVEYWKRMTLWGRGYGTKMKMDH